MGKLLYLVGVFAIWPGIAVAQTQATGLSGKWVSASLDVPAGSTQAGSVDLTVEEASYVSI